MKKIFVIEFRPKFAEICHFVDRLGSKGSLHGSGKIDLINLKTSEE